MQEFTLAQFIFISGVLCALCLAFLITVVQASFPRSIGGVNKWIWACGLCAFSALILSNQLLPPHPLTRVAGNSSFLIGLYLMYRSLHELGQLQHSSRGVLAMVIATCVLFAFFTLVYDSYKGRVIVIMAGNLIACTACIMTLQRFKTKKLPEYYTLFVFICMAVISMSRVLLVSLDLETQSLARTNQFHQKFNAIAYAVLLVSLMFGFMLLVSRRLRDTLIYLSAFNAADAEIRAQQRELEGDLEHAIANDELMLYFQPRISLKTGQVVAVEALLRWRHPVKGMIAPDRFIPAAEHAKLILPIGRWVLERSVATLNRLQQTHPGCRMSVNVSTVQIREGDFVRVVQDALRQAQFDPRQLELEITESVFIDEPEKAAVTFSELKKTGVNLAIDDFGTGYSSLSYLKQFPLDCVKIDRSFINDLSAEQDDRAITTAIVAMGHALGLRVVAEGVETAEQLDFLCGVACDEYQGYLFSKPVPEAELNALLKGLPAPARAEAAAGAHPLLQTAAC
ncbi:MAG TPA: EAL domain-containing protein [Burkholderiaceae bacterium]